jgi:hypothetical protein
MAPSPTLRKVSSHFFLHTQPQAHGPLFCHQRGIHYLTMDCRDEPLNRGVSLVNLRRGARNMIPIALALVVHRF